MTNKRLALNTEGQMTYCSASEENIGKGRCNHIAHQRINESQKDFLERTSSKKDPKNFFKKIEMKFKSIDKENIKYNAISTASLIVLIAIPTSLVCALGMSYQVSHSIDITQGQKEEVINVGKYRNESNLPRSVYIVGVDKQGYLKETQPVKNHGNVNSSNKNKKIKINKRAFKYSNSKYQLGKDTIKLKNVKFTAEMGHKHHMEGMNAWFVDGKDANGHSIQAEVRGAIKVKINKKGKISTIINRKDINRSSYGKADVNNLE